MSFRTALVAAALALAAACNGNTSLTVNAKAAEVSPAPATIVLDLGNGIVVERVRAVVRKLELERTYAADAGVPVTCDGGCCCTGDQNVVCHDAGEDGDTDIDDDRDDAGEDDSDDVVAGPLLADLSAETLAGGLDRIFDGKVPQATYEEMKFVIGPITAARAGSDAGLAEMAARNASIVIDGTIDGAAFTFVSALTTGFEIEGRIVVPDGKASNLTLSLGVQHWFGEPGTRYDPRDPANKAKIERSIRAAVHAFQDDDRDGHDDHHGDQHTGDGICED